MLGMMAGTTSLGYYENAEKIINIPTSLVAALGTVSLPAMSRKVKKEYYTGICENFKISFSFVTPMVVGIMAVSKDLSLLFFGKEFVKSADILFLLAPTVLLDSITAVLRTCYIIPQNKENIYILSTVSGAVLNFAVNSLLIPGMGYYGACIGTIVAVSAVMAVQLFFVKKMITVKKILSIFSPIFLKALIMLIVIEILGVLIQEDILRLSVQVIMGGGCYFFMNYKFFVYEFLKRPCRKHNKRE